MTIKIGDKIPSSQLQLMSDSGVSDVVTDEYFQGRRVALFCVPGAFTPTCSNSHLPGFVENSDAIRAKGIDTIACVSVNDAYVMDAWGKVQGVGEKVDMLADGSGVFSKALGVEVDFSGYGMGVRAKRYSMIVNNGIVETFNLDESGGLDLSSAEKLLDQA